MKKISILLLAALMLFAFTACDPNANETEGVKSYDELVEKIEAGETDISLAADIEITDKLELDVEGLTINGNDHSMIVNEKPADLGTSYLINVTASNVTISNVKFDVKATGVYLIEAGNVGATGFTFKDSAIKGETWATENEGLDASVTIGLNLSTGGKVENCEFTDCYTPIYVNASDVSLNAVKFNSGIVFGADVAAENLVGLQLVATENWDKANIDFSNVAGADIADVREAYKDSGIEVRPVVTETDPA